MSDERLFALLDAMPGAPRLTVGNAQYVHLGEVVLEWRRVGKGDRWALSPSSGVVPADKLPSWWRREVILWANRAPRLNVVGHAMAMGARVA